jgi:hypothetical protein
MRESIKLAAWPVARFERAGFLRVGKQILASEGASYKSIRVQ